MIKKIPNVNFNVRVRDESISGDNPFKWEIKSTKDLFKDKKVILFSLHGAFTTTCSTFQIPDFDKLYERMNRLYNKQWVYAPGINKVISNFSNKTRITIIN